MSRTLYLYPDALWPHEHADCAWSLLDPGAKPALSGQDAPTQWPAAQEHVLILSPDQLVYHQVKLPPGVQWKDAAALAMALEDQLMDDVGQLVVVPLRPHGEEVVCCTLRRQRLTQLLAHLQALGRPSARVESLADKLPPLPGAWHICENEDGALWLHDGRAALDLDAPAGERLPVALALRHAQAAPADLPERVVLHGVAPERLQTLATDWNVPVERSPALDWRSTLSNASTNLLVGDWVPRRRIWREPAMRRALVVIAVCIGLQALMTVGSLGRTWWSIYQVRAEQRAVWQDVAGSAEPTDHPQRRLQQLWQAARARVGESRTDEFIPMLAALTQELREARPSSLDFEQGRLIIVWSGSPQDARALVAGMRQRGYAAVTQSANNGVVTTALVPQETP